MFRGLKDRFNSVARLYKAGPYDKPIVIPNPFDPFEQKIGTRLTEGRLYQLFEPFIRRAQARGYDIWLVQTRTGQNIYEQAAELAQVVNYAASQTPGGKAVIAAYSLAGVTARIATSRWQAERSRGGWSAAERAELGLASELPVSVIVFGDSPLAGAQINVDLQENVVFRLGKASEFNLNSCAAQQLLRQSALSLGDLDLNYRNFYETGQEVVFPLRGTADRVAERPDGSFLFSICDRGPGVFSINGEGWPRGVPIIAFADSFPGPIQCYGDVRDLSRERKDVCRRYPLPKPRAPQVGERLYKVRIPFAGDRDALARPEDLEGGSRLGTVLDQFDCGPFIFSGVCGGLDQFFAGTFIPYSSALPAGAPFSSRRERDFNAVHATFDVPTIDWVLDEIDAVGAGRETVFRLNDGLFCPGGRWHATATGGPPNTPVRLIEEQLTAGRWVETYNQIIGSTNATGMYSGVFTAPAPGTYRARVVVGGEASRDVSYEVRACGGSLGAPSLLAASLTGYEVQLTWRDNSSDEEEFRIQRRDGADGEWRRIGEAGRDVTAFSDSVREPAGVADEYFYRVRAWNASGGSGFSNEVRVVVYRDTPSVVPVLTGPSACIQQRRPVFRWQSVPRATRYWIVVAAAGTDNFFINEPNLTGTSYTPPFDLELGQELRWKVKGCNNSGCGPWSDSVFFTPLCAPSVPPNLLEPFGCTGTLRPAFSWTPVPGVTNYRIVVAPAGTDDFFIDEYPVGTSFAPGLDLVAGREYRFKVRGVNGGNPGEWSRHRFFTPSCQPNQRPGTASPLSPWFSPPAVRTATPTYEWEVASDAMEYFLSVHTASGTRVIGSWYSAASICSGRQCSVRPVTELANGSYYWYLVAHNSVGEGLGSPAVSFAVNVQAPVARPGGPYTGVMGQAISFDARGSFDPDGMVVSYQWDFGNGTSGTGPIPTCVYALPDSYTVTLTVTDDSGLTGSATVVVVVTSRPPVVSVTSEGACTGSGCSVTFTAAATDPDEDPLSYSWTGCGTGSGTRLTCSRSSSAVISATVVVSDGLGGVATATGTRTVYAAAHTTGQWGACTGTVAYSCTSAGQAGCSRPGTQGRTVTETAWTLDPSSAVVPPASGQVCTQTAQGYIASYNSTYDANWTCTAAGPNGCYKNRLSYSAATFRATGPDEAVPPARIYAYGYIAGYYVGEWSACDQPCGVQFRSRTVVPNIWRATAPDVEAPISNQRCDLPSCALTCADHGLYSTRRECQDAGWPVCEIRYRDDGVGGLLTCWAGFN